MDAFNNGSGVHHESEEQQDLKPEKVLRALELRGETLKEVEELIREEIVNLKCDAVMLKKLIDRELKEKNKT